MRTEKEIVEGYTITDKIIVGNKKFAIGHNSASPTPYVTWSGSKDIKGYGNGNYFKDLLAAIKDFGTRVSNEAQRQIELQNQSRQKKFEPPNQGAR